MRSQTRSSAWLRCKAVSTLSVFADCSSLLLSWRVVRVVRLRKSADDLALSRSMPGWGMRRLADLLKNKSRPEAGAHEAAAWVVSEREMKVRLKKEREAREAKEKQEVRPPIDYRSPPNREAATVAATTLADALSLQREKRRKEAQLKDKEKAEQKKKEDEEVHRRLLEERIRVEKAKLEAEAAGSTPESIADTEGSATEDKDEQSGDEQSSGSQTPAEAGQVWVTVNESAP